MRLGPDGGRTIVGPRNVWVSMPTVGDYETEPECMRDEELS